MPQSTTAGFQLSPQQKHLWLAGADESAFNSTIAVALDGAINAQALKDALRKVIARHEALRTTFGRRPGMRVPLQVVRGALAPAWTESDLRPIPAGQQKAKLEQVFTDELRSAFDLSNGPIVRVKLLGIAEKQYVLVISAPALCADALSLQNVVREIADNYAGQSTADEVFQYADFSAWQNELLQAEEEEEDAKSAKRFWSDLFANASVHRLPFEKQATGAFTPTSVAVEIPAQIAGKDAAFFAACWHILQWKLTGQTAITVSHVSNGRNHEEVAASVGLFAKPLPIPYEFDSTRSFTAVMQDLQGIHRRAYEQQDYLVLGDSAESPAAFVAETVPAKSTVAGVDFSILSQTAETLRPRIQLRVVTSAGSSKLELQFDARCFSPATAQRIAGQFSVLLKSGGEEPSAPIAELEILDSAERQRVVVEFNKTAVEYAGAKCFHHLFEEQAARTPNQPSLRFGETVLTYAELNTRANQVAYLLRASGVKPDTAVGLCLERSAEMMIGVLGILKAGGAYVPLIPDNPKDRLAHQLFETKAPVLLTEKKFLATLPQFSGKTICFDQDHATLAAQTGTNPEHVNAPENTAYVIYTSGSTGVPKGVAVSHANLVNYSNFICDRLKARTEALNFATVSTLGADLGNTAVFPALISGGCLHVISYETAMAGNLFAEYARKYPIDVLKITPSHLGSVLASPEGANMLPRKFLVLGGEAASWDLVSKVRAAQKCSVINHYGPTEATVGCCTFGVSENNVSEWEPKTVPVGKPIANDSVYILDSLLRPVPVGVPGELCVAGAGIAKGYLNQPQQTAERFVKDPFSSDANARMYRTGDLARFLPDGNIEFLGRVDQQVKIRGFRVEPAEIENVLKQHQTVQQALVLPVADKSGDKRLVAYVVSAKKPGASTDDLRTFLGNKLPDYMVPSAIVQIDALPLTKNGKVDVAALPSPETVATEESHVAPRNPAEQQLVEIWREVLHIENFGVQDNFFELGGHSLLATQVISRVRSAFHVQLPLRSLFDAPTVAGLATEIARTPQSSDDEELAKLLSELEGLSDEEAERLLANESGSNSETR
jgi:amino acid adenylation domain-containing protein